ncbi:hypothetical protein BCA37_10875 [Mycobacterium sp. djl-10]|nr:hypothetical protein BCA37_10875 [Mycobacterium sp. djl-10]
MPTYVTRIVVTQVNDYQPPPEEWTMPPGLQVWIIEWTKGTGPRSAYRTIEVSIEGARRMTTNLLKERPPGKSVEDVLTLVGFVG